VLRDAFLTRLAGQIPHLRQNCADAPRIAGNLSLRFPGVRALDLMAATPDLCVSTGSACTSAELAPSHVLTAIGLSPAQAAATLRVGMGRFTSRADIETAADYLAGAYDRLLAAVPQPEEA
jgi:cysteine desulfurase